MGISKTIWSNPTEFIRVQQPENPVLFFAPTMEHTAGKFTDEQKQYSYLRNVPFSIVPKDANNKFVGDFKPIEGLLYSKDVNLKVQTASLQEDPTSGIEETSLLLNDLNACPPPKKK